MTDSPDAAMRPRIRPDVFWVPTSAGGVYAVSSRGRMTLAGTDVDRWLDRLEPFLDGTHTLAELAGGLDPQRRAKVEDLVGRLHHCGLVEDLARTEPDTLSDAERQRYAGQLRYLAQYTDAPGLGFKRYRDCRLVVVGGGSALLALLAATLRAGSRYITALVTHAGGIHPERLAGLVDAAGRDDPSRTCVVRHIDGADLEAAIAELAGDTDLVVQLSEQPGDSLDRVCARYGMALGQATLHGGVAWLAPVGPRSDPGSHWESARRRLVGQDAGTASTEPLHDGAVELLANMLALRCFRYLTGVDPAASVAARHSVGPRELVRLDLSALATTTHLVMPHPHALPASPPTRAGFRARIARLASGPATDEWAFSRAAAGCVDPRGGVLTALDERHFDQLPLWVTAAFIADPDTALASRGIPTTVYGAAPEFGTARCRAARRALELYSWAMLDGRLFVDAHGRPQEPGAEPGTGRLRAWRLDGGGELLVPARAVLDPRAADGSPIPIGVASGPTWAAAVEAGLIRCCEADTVAEALAAGSPFPAVDLDQAELDSEGRRMLGILRLAAAPVETYDITGSLGIPTYTLCLEGRAAAHVSGWTAVAALGDGLERVVLAQQARIAGQPEYHPLAVPDLPSRLRSARVAEPHPPEPHHADRTSWMCGALAQRGCVPVAVPLDHDPALAAILPYAVRVLIWPAPPPV